LPAATDTDTGRTARLYAFSFFDDFILIYPLYAVMFAQAGVRPLQITILFAVWSLTSFLLEVPAGVIADRFPRRTVLTLGLLLRAGGFGVWLVDRRFAGFLVGFVLWGLKSAFTSGTKEALVYDQLRQVGQLPLYARVTGRMQSLSLMAVVGASLLAAALVPRGYSLLLTFSIAAILVSAWAVWSLPPAPHERSGTPPSYLGVLRSGGRLVRQRADVLYWITLLSVVAGLGAGDEYFGVFLRQHAYSNTGIAVWTAVIFLLGALGSAVAHRWGHQRLPVVPILFGWAAVLYAAAVAPRNFGPVLLGGYLFVFGAARVLANARLQDLLTDSVRATVTSVGGVGSEFLGLISFGLMGLGSEGSRGYAAGYEWMAYAIAAAACSLLLLHWRIRSEAHAMRS
jgi:MFS family permease